MKFFICFAFTLFYCFNTTSLKSQNNNGPNTSSSSTITNNSQTAEAFVESYKTAPNPFGLNSLFSGHNSELLSASNQAVPPTLASDNVSPNNNDSIGTDPERQIAMRIVEQYRNQFDYLDAITVNDVIEPEELAVAYKNFDWPRRSSDTYDEVEYARSQIERFDVDKKNGLSFPEYCEFMEDLWNVNDEKQERDCLLAFNKAMETFNNLFKWLDRDNRGFLKDKDLIYGLSRMMYRDVNIDEIANVMKQYGGTEGQLNYENFLLAIANGLLDDSLKDPNITNTF